MFFSGVQLPETREPIAAPSVATSIYISSNSNISGCNKYAIVALSCIVKTPLTSIYPLSILYAISAIFPLPFNPSKDLGLIKQFLVTSNPNTVILQPESNTILAACGSWKIFASTTLLTFPPLSDPPIITISSILSFKWGYSIKNTAILVKDPTATKVIFSSELTTISFIASTALFSNTFLFVLGSSYPPIPFAPCIAEASLLGLKIIALSIPFATGISLPKKSTNFNALSVVISTLTLPNTVVINSIFKSFFIAADIAIASSIPGSVSNIIFLLIIFSLL